MNLPPPTLKELRHFGLLMAMFIALIGGVLLPWITSVKVAYTPWIISTLFATVAILAPVILKPIFKFWMMFGAIVERINTFIILLVIWVVMFIPISIALRLCRYNPLQLGFDNHCKSYRIVRTSAPDKSSLENPF